MKPLYLTLLFALITLNIYAQKTSKMFFDQKVDIAFDNIEIPTHKAAYFTMDLALFNNDVKSFQGRRSSTIVLPLPDGTFDEFSVTESQVMSDNLAAKYPNIKTYQGISVNNNSSVRFDITPKGFHAMVFTDEGTVYIDPINRQTVKHYQSYYKMDFDPMAKGSFQEGQPIDYNPELTKQINAMVARGVQPPSRVELRTYRLAISATGEYTAFHGGTVEGALSAIVTTMNRVNGIYEKEVAIRMVLVENTDKLIFTNSSTDGFSNSDANALIDEVQQKIDEVIGDSNYDIGHGVSTGGGGLAGLGVPCQSGRKGSGITGSSSPIGDPYDVDYVAHEIGHQFGGNHTFNGSTGSCAGGNRTASTAYEPGSGTTIMAYAGICSGQNVQSNSDAYFHSQSFDQIIAYSTLSAGNSCAVVTTTSNSSPVVEVGESEFTIPKSTPFKLDGNATDPDGDILTYSWEQFDLGPSGAPDSPTENAPLFRSFAPKEVSYRVFPQNSDIVNNSSTMGEILPSYTRDMTFRLTARDNKAGGGGVAYDQMNFKVTDQAGPFVISSPNTNESITALTTYEVVWDVANTNIAPVNCLKVNVLLSTDGGNTYPEILVTGADNDGKVNVLIPDMTTDEARIKVEAADNVFFDISNNNFSIVPPSSDNFSVFVDNESLQVCSPNSLVINVKVSELGKFDSPVTLSTTGLPDTYGIVFSSNPVVPGNDVSLTISNTGSEAGDFNLNIKGVSGEITQMQGVTLEVLAGAPITATLLTPVDNETNSILFPTLAWNEVNGADSYELSVALDANFTNEVQNILLPNQLVYAFVDKLGSNTRHFWRVKAINQCGEGSFSEARSFVTSEVSCFTSEYTGEAIHISESGTPTITSTLQVTQDGVINDVNILQIKATHTWTADLTAVLISPVGTSVTLFTGICGDNDDFDLGFDDQSGNATVSCPPTDKKIYKPAQDLSIFGGEGSVGTWTLEIRDEGNGDGGSLDAWSIEFCVNGIVGEAPNAATELTAQTISSSQIDLLWTDNADDETGYVVQRSEGGNKNYIDVITLAANNVNYSDMSLEGDVTYYYRIKSINGTNSSFSNEVSSKTDSSVPNAPTGLKLESVSSEFVKILWEDNSSIETEYVIERSMGSNIEFVEVAVYEANTILYTDLDVIGGMTYFYRVKARNLNGSSEYTNELEQIVSIAPPAKPTNFIGTVNSANQITLTWDDNASNETSYVIERSVADVNSYEMLVTLEADVTNHEDAGLTPSTQYSYRISAKNDGGFSQGVLTDATTPMEIPLAPSELEIVNGVTSVTLEWNDNSDKEEEFIVERSVGINTNYIEIGSVSSDVLVFIDEGIDSKTTYFYRVLARNNGGDSNYSNEVTIAETLSNAPTELISESSINQIKLQWKDNSENETGFVVERSIGSNSNYLELITVSSDIAEYNDGDTEPGTNYFYRVLARNSGGDSGYSNEINSDLVTGLIDDILNQPVSIYPNPSSGIFNVKVNNTTISDISIVVVNLLGEVVLKEVIQSDEVFDLSDQPNGIYIFKLISDKTYSIYRMIKN
jgi:subtilisin-like proprotein convertase family protein